MNIESQKLEFTRLIRHLNAQGHSPATSTNYSFIDDSDRLWITRSGFDKSLACEKDFIEVNRKGIPKKKSDVPSAETLIHCALYNLFLDCRVILHSHSIYPVLLSSIVNDNVIFSGYEIQKGFKNQESHLSKIKVPIFSNSQRMEDIVFEINNRKEEITCFSIVLRKHGVYVWGSNLMEAKRHLETLDYLCQCEYKLALINGNT